MRPTIVQWLAAVFGDTLAPWLVPTADVLYALAVGAGIALYAHRSRALGLSQYHALGSAVWAVAAGFVGARMLYLLLRPAEILQQPEMIWDLSGSTISWGAYLGGAVVLAGYCAFHGQSFRAYADVAVSTLGLCTCIGRVACLLNGDDFGSVSNVPWAVTYPPGSYAFAAHVDQGLIDPAANASAAVHPVQLYLAGNALFLFAIFSLWIRLRPPAGTLLLAYGCGYGATRFVLELYRGDDAGRTFVCGVPDAQAIAIVITLVSLVGLGTASFRRRTAGARRSAA